MFRFGAQFRIFATFILVFCPLLPASLAALPSTGLVGAVKSPDGSPMEGVQVSAQLKGQTFITSVYTNKDGEYVFPALSDGQYHIWVQAVGFKEADSEQTVSSGNKTQRDFTLATLEDFERQLSAVEWADSLPDGTPEDQRMKMIFVHVCSDCHASGFPLSHRFDAAGWGIIVDAMMSHQTTPGSLERGTLQGYKNELVQYLTKIRGPEPYSWNFKPLPRPTGESTQIVVTEYLIPRGDHPKDYIDVHNGTHWSEGFPSKWFGDLHDAAPAGNGYVYFSDPGTPERGVGKLDPRTGHVTSFNLLDENGSGPHTHGIAVDKVGNVWLSNETDGTILKFDTHTEQFKRFPRPPSSSPVEKNAIDIALDSKGDVWTTRPSGAQRLDPETGEYTDYKSPTPGGQPYGLRVDADDNAWFNRFQGDRIGFVDGKTGQVSEVILPAPDEKINPKDIEISKDNAKMMINGFPSVYQRGPRRLGADLHGNTIWVGEFFAGRLTKIDIHTRKVTEYESPLGHYSHPYSVVVDKNHMVWFTMANTDRIAKFNPFTEQFTVYPVPSLGTDSRFISVDDKTDPPTIWVSPGGLAKIDRIQFRTGSNGRNSNGQ